MIALLIQAAVTGRGAIKNVQTLAEHSKGKLDHWQVVQIKTLDAGESCNFIVHGNMNIRTPRRDKETQNYLSMVSYSKRT